MSHVSTLSMPAAPDQDFLELLVTSSAKQGHSYLTAYSRTTARFKLIAHLIGDNKDFNVIGMK
jgi:hypothetical protein